MVGEVVGLVEGEMGSLEVSDLRMTSFILGYSKFSGGRREAADRATLHQQSATHALEKRCRGLQSLPGTQVVVKNSYQGGNYKKRHLHSGPDLKIVVRNLLQFRGFVKMGGQSSLKEGFRNVIMKICRSIYLSQFNSH